MKTRNPAKLSRGLCDRTVLRLAGAVLIAGLSVAAHARQPALDPEHGAKATKDSPPPPADAMPSGDPKSGVVKPPNVDPKMAKPVPDIDPAMDNRPPDKAPTSTDPAAPKVQPR